MVMAPGGNLGNNSGGSKPPDFQNKVATFWSGPVVPPSASLGNNGDWYFATNGGVTQIYVKLNGSWASVA
jgi:hypothetical protein